MLDSVGEREREGKRESERKKEREREKERQRERERGSADAFAGSANIAIRRLPENSVRRHHLVEPIYSAWYDQSDHGFAATRGDGIRSKSTRRTMSGSSATKRSGLDGNV